MLLEMVIATSLLGITNPQTSTSETALLEAARQGDRAKVEALLNEGADIDSRSRYGATPLFFAADRGHLDLVRLLVERGAELDIEDTFYRTSPLHRALGAKHFVVAQYLLCLLYTSDAADE